MSMSLIFCGHCGAQNPHSENFCFACGHALLTSSAGVSVLVAPSGPLPEQTLLKERYRVQRTVGQGGMGAVYLAQDTHLNDRQVAIKEMSQSNSQQAQEVVENFTREAHLLASLQHPNLPNIYDHFEEHGRWYLVMSFIQGETLEEYLELAREHKLSLTETLKIGDALCDVLDYLHEHQPPIIFRDLKPGNIMRTPEGQIFLIDFGIARHFKPGQTRDTVSYGSMGYAPPEQYGKAQTTTRSDIYALGATLYECLTGYDPSQSPFRLPPLASLAPTLPRALVRLIMQMLELDESKRPADATIVRQRLQQAGASISPLPRQYTPVPAAIRHTPSRPSPTPSTSTRIRQVYRQMQIVNATATQSPYRKALAEFTEIFSSIGMLIATALASFGLLGLCIVPLDSGNTVNDVAIGQLLISLGIYFFFIARKRAKATPQMQQMERLRARICAIIIMVAGVVTAFVGGNVMISIFSIIIGFLLWLQPGIWT